MDGRPMLVWKTQTGV